MNITVLNAHSTCPANLHVFILSCWSNFNLFMSTCLLISLLVTEHYKDAQTDWWQGHAGFMAKEDYGTMVKAGFSFTSLALKVSQWLLSYTWTDKNRNVCNSLQLSEHLNWLKTSSSSKTRPNFTAPTLNWTSLHCCVSLWTCGECLAIGEDIDSEK